MNMSQDFRIKLAEKQAVGLLLCALAKAVDLIPRSLAEANSIVHRIKRQKLRESKRALARAR